MNRTPLILTTALLLLSIPPATAEQDSTKEAVCLAYDVANVGLIINGGRIVVCIYFPETVEHTNSVWNLGTTVTSPLITAVGTPINTITITNSGCTAGTTTARTVLVGSFASSWQTPMTMTSDFCSGKVRAQVSTAGLVAVLDVELPFHVSARTQAINAFLCNAPATTANDADPDATTCNTPQLNNYNFLCDAPGATPTAAPAASTTCNDPNITGTLTLNGIPDTQQEIQAIADALNAGLSVEICPEGAPCYMVNSGELGVNILDDTTDDDMLTVPAAMVDNQTVIIPSEIMVSNATLDTWWPVLLWAIAFIFFLVRSKLAAAVACFIGLGVSLIQAPFSLHIIPLAALGITLWLEAFLMERIYAKWFDMDEARRESVNQT